MKKEKEKLPEKVERKEAGEVSRRDFLVGVGTVVVGGAIGAGLLSSCNGETVTTTVKETTTKTVPTTVTAAATTVTDTVTTTVGADTTVTATATKTVTSTVTSGEAPAPIETSIINVDWMLMPAANACCVDHQNGKIVRIRPLHYDWKYDQQEFNPNDIWKIEVRGKTFRPFMKTLVPPLSISYKKRVYSPNRIKYPLKRVDWEPGGDPAKINSQNRGKSKFVRISWDEATDIVVSEIKRIQEKYGPEAVFCCSGSHSEAKQIQSRWKHKMILNKLNPGGWTNEARNPDSWEGWYWGCMHMWGDQAQGKMTNLNYCFPDVLENTEMIILQGSDPDTNTWGWTGQWNSVFYYWCMEVGIKLVYISPDLNYANAAHPDKWIPVLPNTDAALHLAISYVWITEDSYDKDYVDTHTYGFEKYKEYVLGNDGTPKTPKWAEARCGVKSYTIKALAREWAAKKTSVSHCNGGSYIRGPYATEPARLEVCNLAMQAVGSPGRHQLTHIEGQFQQAAVTYGSVVQPNVAAAGVGSLRSGTCKQQIAKLKVPQGLQGESLSWYGLGGEPVTLRESQFIKHQYPEEGCSRIHMMWYEDGGNLQSWNGAYELEKGWQNDSIEFILFHNIWLEGDLYYADIILPVCTVFEADDIGVDTYSGQFHTIFPQNKCIDPIGESKTDMEVYAEITKKFGDDLYNWFSRDGMSVGDMVKEGYEKSGVADLVSWEDFVDKGYYVVPLRTTWVDEWKQGAGWYKWYMDPENNPLPTKSGLIEFECQDLLEFFPDDQERKPVPQWITGGPGQWHDESLWGERCKQYPLLIVSNHPRWRVHAMHDDITWLREIPTCKVKGPDGYMYEPVWINPINAAARDIKTGDIVKIFNERGAVLGGAYVTERIISGAVYQDHGARPDEIIPGELDRGGCNNFISPLNTICENATGMATSGYLVEIEKVSLDQMEEWKKQYPAAFERPYDPASGLRFDAWIEGGV